MNKSYQTVKRESKYKVAFSDFMTKAATSMAALLIWEISRRAKNYQLESAGEADIFAPIRNARLKRWQSPEAKPRGKAEDVVPNQKGNLINAQ